MFISGIISNQLNNFIFKFQKSMKNASIVLFNALHSRAYFAGITIILPDDWPLTCLPSYFRNQTSAKILQSSGEKCDVTVTVEHPIYQNNMWTESHGGCGVQGNQIYASYLSFSNDEAGKEFVQQFVRYRYGVFDEDGFNFDPIYPTCWQIPEELRENG